MDTDMALDGVVNLQQDEDSQYEQHERDAMKAIELSDLKKETFTLADKLKNGLKDDIFAKNEEYVMRTEMGTLFASTVLPSEAPKQWEWEADSSFRIRIMKYLLKNALPKEWLPEGISAWVIDEKVPDLTTNDILALHYFQLLRHIPGKSKPDAICGPLTMKDLLAANGVDLKDKLGDDYIEQEDFVFTKDVEKIEDREKLNHYDLSDVTSNAIIYKIWERYYFTWKNTDWTQWISELCKKWGNSQALADLQNKENPQQSSEDAKISMSVESFKQKYFSLMPEVYEEFIKSIGQLKLDDIPNAKDMSDISLFTSTFGENFFFKQNWNSYELRCISPHNFANLNGGWVKISDFDLEKHIIPGKDGGISFDWEAYKKTIKQAIKNTIQDIKNTTERNAAQQVVDKAKYRTEYSLKQLYKGDKTKQSDFYYKGVITFLWWTLSLHNDATRLSKDGKQMWYTLGNFDYPTWYSWKEYLKDRYVAIKDITDANWKFNKEKWKQHLAVVIDDCVRQYKDKNKEKNNNEIA